MNCQGKNGSTYSLQRSSAEMFDFGQVEFLHPVQRDDVGVSLERLENQCRLKVSASSYLGQNSLEITLGQDGKGSITAHERMLGPRYFSENGPFICEASSEARAFFARCQLPPVNCETLASQPVQIGMPAPALSDLNGNRLDVSSAGLRVTTFVLTRPTQAGAPATLRNQQIYFRWNGQSWQTNHGYGEWTNAPAGTFLVDEQGNRRGVVEVAGRDLFIKQFSPPYRISSFTLNDAVPMVRFTPGEGAEKFRVSHIPREGATALSGALSIVGTAGGLAERSSSLPISFDGSSSLVSDCQGIRSPTSESPAASPSGVSRDP